MPKRMASTVPRTLTWSAPRARRRRSSSDSGAEATRAGSSLVTVDTPATSTSKRSIAPASTGGVAADAPAASTTRDGSPGSSTRGPSVL